MTLIDPRAGIEADRRPFAGFPDNAYYPLVQKYLGGRACSLMTFEIEGGLVIKKARGRVETPFQLEGMNGMGLAGLEIHGLIGYDLLAKYRMEIDFTRDKMTWTELDYTPKLPPMLKGGGGGGQAELEMMGSVMKSVGGFLNRKATPEISLRGFYGMTLADGDEYPKVTAVLGKGPAAVLNR